MKKSIKLIRATTVPMSLAAFCSGMLRVLSAKYEVIALSSPDEDLERVADAEGVRAIAVPMERHIAVLKDIKALWSLARVFRKEKPTIVHSMTPKAGLLCMLAAWMTRVPVRIHTFTGLVFPTSTGLKRRILMFTDRMTCACATHIIPEGEGVKNDLLNYGITRKNMEVLGFGNVRGVDMEFYSRRPEVLRKAQEIRKPVFTFVFVGRIVRDKGINELCEAFGRLSETEAVRLILVGPYEDNLDPISERSRQMIQNNAAIESVGAKVGDDLLAYYAAADCYVFPSYREGFPNTVLEAGAMGLPSIVTDINGSREIIVQGKNGVIIPSQDSEALYNAMLNMLKDSDAREEMAGNAREMIASRYEQGYVRKCLYDFYDRVLQAFL